MSSLRSDFPLIRHISKKFDPLIGRSWQDLPLIQMDINTMNIELGSSGKPLAKAFLNLPFDDFVMEMDGTGYSLNMETDNPGLRGEVHLVKYWFRVTKAQLYKARIKQFSPWYDEGYNTKLYLQSNEPVTPEVFVEIWLQNTITPDMHFTPFPEVNALQTSPFRMVNAFIEKEAEMLMKLPEPQVLNILKEYRKHLIMCSVLLHQLQIMEQYMVEVRPEVVKPRKHGLKDPKPWTYEYLPRIILLDPHSTHNTSPSNTATHGTHASPRPHQRRGHLRKYKSARYTNMRGKTVRVKPSWVGPKNWVLNGSVYKVLGV